MTNKVVFNLYYWLFHEDFIAISLLKYRCHRTRILKIKELRMHAKNIY